MRVRCAWSILDDRQIIHNLTVFMDLTCILRGIKVSSGMNSVFESHERTDSFISKGVIEGDSDLSIRI